MTRDAYSDRLLDLAYGELPAREAREVETHAAACEACRAELARIRGTRRIMAALPDEPAPERGERILLAAAREAAEARRPRRLVPRWLLGGAVAVASIAIVAVVSYRVADVAPRRDDQNALLGPSPYASPPPPAAGAPPAAQAEPGPTEAKREAAPEAKRAAPVAPPRATRREATAQARPDEGRGFASPPPAAPAPSAAPLATPAPAPAVELPGAGVAAREDAKAPGALRKSAAAPGARSEAAAGDVAAAGGTEVRTFPGCEGEAVRRVERDARGRTVRYVREGTFGGRRLRIEHVFGPGGLLAAVTSTDLDTGAAVDPRGLGISLPPRAEDAGIDAPPRCGR